MNINGNCNSIQVDVVDNNRANGHEDPTAWASSWVECQEILSSYLNRSLGPGFNSQLVLYLKFYL